MVSGTATTPIVAGQLCWHEVATREPDKTADFYTALLGWTTEATDMDGTPYTFFKQGDHVVADMMSIAGDVIERRQDQWI